MWKPKDPKAISLVKLGLWAAILTWMVFALSFSIIAAQRLALAAPRLFGVGVQGQVLAYVAPIWVVFTTLMLIWAMARFANRKLRDSKPSVQEPE